MKRLIGLYFLIIAGNLSAGGNDPKDISEREPVRIRGRQKAPEFADIEAWINSEPLTMEKLKGKVVVVHFITFG